MHDFRAAKMVLPCQMHLSVLSQRFLLSESRFVYRVMKNGKKSIRLDPIQSEASMRMNPD